MNLLKQVNLRGRKLNLPAFFPDATYGHIISLNSKDIEKCETQGVVVNTYHLFRTGLIEKVKKIGIHRYMKLNLPIISDSGGFQVFSLIHRKPDKGKIGENEVEFYLDSEKSADSQTLSHKKCAQDEGEKIILSPEKCIQIQLKIGADIIMCLDDCTHAELDKEKQKKAVDRTIRWARRCKNEFERLTRKMSKSKKPLLFAIVQGGEIKELRKKCAEKLIERSEERRVGKECRSRWSPYH